MATKTKMTPDEFRVATYATLAPEIVDMAVASLVVEDLAHFDSSVEKRKQAEIKKFRRAVLKSYIEVRKHYKGQHDQKDHGNREPKNQPIENFLSERQRAMFDEAFPQGGLEDDILGWITGRGFLDYAKQRQAQAQREYEASIANSVEGDIGNLGTLLGRDLSGAAHQAGHAERILGSAQDANWTMATREAIDYFGVGESGVGKAVAALSLLGRYGPRLAQRLTMYRNRFQGHVLPPDPGNIKGYNGNDMKAKVSNYLWNRVKEQGRGSRLSAESGGSIPSEGLIINQDGEVVARALGVAGDTYMPFNYNQLSKFKGSTLVRSRDLGGPTREDLHQAMLLGADTVRVVSRNGVFEIGLSDISKGLRNTNHISILNRYDRLLSNTNRDYDGYDRALQALRSEFPLYFKEARGVKASPDSHIPDRKYKAYQAQTPPRPSTLSSVRDAAQGVLGPSPTSQPARVITAPTGQPVRTTSNAYERQYGTRTEAPERPTSTRTLTDEQLAAVDFLRDAPIDDDEKREILAEIGMDMDTLREMTE